MLILALRHAKINTHLKNFQANLLQPETFNTYLSKQYML